MKVAIYARYSTDLQDKSSIAGQISNCEALAGREGLEVVATFTDEGISGNDDSRPQYQAMLKELVRNTSKFEGIVCDETSRITRNQAELHRLVAELKFRDQFLIAADGIDTRNESAEIVLAVKAAIDAMESRKIGYRTYRAMRERHKGGHSAGGKTFGYSSVQNGDYWKRVIDLEQAKVILETFERYAAGESAKKIVRDFNERGIPSPGSYWKTRTRRCAGWCHTSLLGSYSKASGILRHPIYTGRATWNKKAGKKVPGTGRRIQKLRPQSDWIEHYDPGLRIVSDKLFDAVQARLREARRRHVRKSGRPARYLFSGILKCASCGGHYSVINKTYYRCTSQSNGRDSLCTQKQGVRIDRVGSVLLADIKRQLLAPEFAKEMTKRIRAIARKGAVRRTPDQTSRRRELDRQINDLAETICEVGKSDILTAKLKKLEKEQSELTLNLANTPSMVHLTAGADTAWREVVENLESLHKYAKPDEVETARQALKGIIGEVTVVEEGGRVLAYPKLGQVFVDKTGAGRGNRTPTSFRKPDFESGASTSSATPALIAKYMRGNAVVPQ